MFIFFYKTTQKIPNKQLLSGIFLSLYFYLDYLFYFLITFFVAPSAVRMM